MSETWFSSDTHFNHKNIIKYCNRPFDSVEEMNEGIVKNWNAVVTPEDTVWHLGDVTWGHFDMNRLNGKKNLILGNHDSEDRITQYFEEVYIYHELKGLIPKRRAIVLFHYPIESWNGKFYGSLHLHGHCHNTINNTGLLRFDMGVDCWDFKPVTIEAVLALESKRMEEAHIIDEQDRDSKFKS
jgi:calcineurin-like phosphoesterase family protein